MGTVTTVAVAWALAASSDGPYPYYSVQPTHEWPAPVPGDWPPEAHEVVAAEAFGLTYTDASNGSIQTGALRYQNARHFGWPARSMVIVRNTAWNRDEDFPGLDIGLPARWQDGISVYEEIRILPTVPILHGFLIDTLFYAGCWWIVPVAFLEWRRWRRRRRGDRCVTCGYLSGGLPVYKGEVICPECGAIDRARCRESAES